jgi:hypothetical protein
MDSVADKLRRPLDSKPVSPSLFAHSCCAPRIASP